jgi:hypothetical protein
LQRKNLQLQLTKALVLVWSSVHTYKKLGEEGKKSHKCANSEAGPFLHEGQRTKGSIPPFWCTGPFPTSKLINGGM